MSQTPETNDIALVHLKSPMEMTEFVQVRGKFFCHCHFCRHHYHCYAFFSIIVENTQRTSLPLRSGYSPDKRGGAWGRLYHSWLGHTFSRVSYSWQVRCHHSRHEQLYCKRHQRFKDTRFYAALRAADLEWIVGPGYSLGGYILEKNHENPTWNHEKTWKNHEKP